MVPTCRPRLYVYDSLPARYRDDREGGYGAPLSSIRVTPLLPSLSGGTRLWHTPEFGLGELFLRRAEQYRCRTMDAERSDLFLIPAYSSRLHGRPTERMAEHGNMSALYARLRNLRVDRCASGSTNCSALEARGGADHLLINPRNGAAFERHPFAVSKSMRHVEQSVAPLHEPVHAQDIELSCPHSHPPRPPSNVFCSARRSSIIWTRDSGTSRCLT